MAKTSSSVSVQLEDILDDYSVDLKRATNNSMDVVAKKCAAKLRNTSPKKSGDYAKSWGVKRDRGNHGINDVTVRNKDHYQLTHLLENGHIIRNAKGEYGRTRGIKHIAPVAEWANAELPAEIEREMNK